MQGWLVIPAGAGEAFVRVKLLLLEEQQHVVPVLFHIYNVHMTDSQLALGSTGLASLVRRSTDVSTGATFAKCAVLLPLLTHALWLFVLKLVDNSFCPI